MKDNDSNKLRINYISGGKSLFWSRIAARRIHQPRFIIYYITCLVFYVYLHYRYDAILLTIVLLYYINAMLTCIQMLIYMHVLL